MSDPIPSATADPDHVEQSTNAEDRKAAAALSSLHTNEITTEDASGSVSDSTNQEALGKAMSRLEIVAGQGSKKTGAVKKSTAPVKKPVAKIAAADVALLVDQLELTKTKAMELLRVHDGDALKAMKDFIAPSFRV